MPTAHTAKIFINGNSQAVRLPKQFRIEASEVFIRKDAASGDIVLSTRPLNGGWADFFALRDKVTPQTRGDLLKNRPMNKAETVRDPFAKLPESSPESRPAIPKTAATKIGKQTTKWTRKRTAKKTVKRPA